MTIKVYTDPWMIDFLKVCAAMPQDERDQIAAVSGEPYDIDGAAIGNFTVAGPKWVVKADDEPICVGGFVPMRRGVWRDFMLTTPAAWAPAHWFAVTRICRRAMDAMFTSGQAHRLECVTLANRRPEVYRWYSTLRYTKEATMQGYYANGADAVLYSRVKHVN